MICGNKNNTIQSESKLWGAEDNDCKMTNNNDTKLYNKYIHDIRNMRSLNKEMINNIRNMSNEEKMDIIIMFNDMIEYINSIL
jgi:hypothetical protein